MLDALLAGRDWSRWHYFEPMVGGGAAYWRFGRRFKDRAIADACPELVNFYRVVRDDVGSLVDALRGPAMWFEGLDDPASEAHFRAMRDRYGRGSDLERAATFVFLNKAAINGLHRLNRLGRFNAGPGSYKGPLFCDEPTLRACSAALQGTPIVCRSVSESLRWFRTARRRNSLLFVDPPYHSPDRPGFTGYAGGFSASDQASLVAALLAAGRAFIYTNSDTPFIRSLFAGAPVTMLGLPLRHKVGPGKARGLTTGELLVHNL